VPTVSNVPTRDNDYQFRPAPAVAKLDRRTWNVVLGDVGFRLRAIEEKRTELQDLIDDLSFAGVQRLDQAINPLIVGVQRDLDTLKTSVAATVAANDRIISDFQAVTAVNLEELQDQINEVQTRINVILAGGLDAADVRESTTRVFVSPAEKAEIGKLRTDVNAKASKESPEFTGNPKAPTAAFGDADTTLANTEFVQRAIDSVRLDAMAYALCFGGS